jgi:hypothetical protein
MRAIDPIVEHAHADLRRKKTSLRLGEPIASYQRASQLLVSLSGVEPGYAAPD